MIELGANAAAYNKRKSEVKWMRPVGCPGCAYKHIVAHDWYDRWAVSATRDVEVSIRRWKCKNCGQTISLLPSFLHPHRHYELAVMEGVLRRTEGMPGPSERSTKRWLRAHVMQYEQHWLKALMSVLAQVEPLMCILDPHGPQVTHVAELGDMFARWFYPKRCNTLSEMLRTTWCWGWNHGIGRLI